MKEISELNLPEDVYYTKNHEWARLDGEEAIIGITDYAQDQLGDIVFVEMPQAGDSFGKGEEFGTVESVKAVAELYLPIGGEIVSVNSSLEESPELVNASPHGDGWIARIRPADPGEMNALMSKNAYLEMLKGV
ncbi:MAG TPA: glycine cleavage system protein GcvH [Deltaproteobacteria bacterium]|nr:glycine cleavage system protein GcvH [Deltaproteobacteria bacterium]